MKKIILPVLIIFGFLYLYYIDSNPRDISSNPPISSKPNKNPAASLPIPAPVPTPTPPTNTKPPVTTPTTPSSGTYAIKITSDIKYGTGATSAGSKNLLLDMYAPVGGPSNRPAFLAIHGGGFKAGDKTNDIVVAVCKDLASRGVSCFSIDYRLESDDPTSPGATLYDRAINASVEDVSLAANFLVSNKNTYNINPSKIAIGGSSAGAGTSLIAAYLNPNNAPTFVAVVDMWGSLRGNEYIIERGEAPLIVFHGTADPKVPYAEGQALITRAEAVGIPNQFVPIQGGGHSTDAVSTLGEQNLLDLIAEFVFKYF